MMDDDTGLPEGPFPGMPHLFQAFVEVVQLAQRQPEAAADGLQVSATDKDPESTLQPSGVHVKLD